MKKILFFLVLGVQIFSNNLDDRLKEIEAKKNAKMLGSFSKVTVSTNVTNRRERKYLKTNYTDVGVDTNYGWFNHEIVKNMNLNKIVKHNIGVSKNLNDFFYDYKKENVNEYLIEKDNVIQEDFEKKLLNYKMVGMYNLTELEYNLFNIEVEKLKMDEEILDKQYLLGVISKNDYDFTKSNIKLMISKLNLLLNEMSLIKLKLEENDVNKNDYVLSENLDVNEDEIKRYVVNNILAKRKQEINRAELMYKKNNVYNKAPQFNLRFFYDIIDKNYVTSLNIFKEFNFYDENSVNTKNLYDEAMKNKNKLDVFMTRNIAELINNYEKLKIEYLESENYYNKIKKELQIIEKKYELGSDKLINLIEKRNELIKSKVNMEKIKLELSLLVLKIKRGAK